MNESVPGQAPVSSAQPQPAAGSTVTVRYWAAARAASGTAEETCVAASLADVLAAIEEAHHDSARFAAVLGVCSFLVGDTPVGKRRPSDVPVRPGDVVEVLPPFAGG